MQHLPAGSQLDLASAPGAAGQLPAALSGCLLPASSKDARLPIAYCSNLQRACVLCDCSQRSLAFLQAGRWVHCTMVRLVRHGQLNWNMEVHAQSTSMIVQLVKPLYAAGWSLFSVADESLLADCFSKSQAACGFLVQAAVEKVTASACLSFATVLSGRARSLTSSEACDARRLYK